MRVSFHDRECNCRPLNFLGTIGENNMLIYVFLAFLMNRSFMELMELLNFHHCRR